MSSSIPKFVQDSGVPFDLFIQSLTEQLDKAQAGMALKAKVGKMPLTFAVKEVTLDLRAFVQILDDEIYIKPAGPGDSEASTIKLGLTTITKPMIEENAVDFTVEDPKISLREVLGDDKESKDLQRSLERIGVRNVNQLTELRQTAGTDVIARLARLPHNRLQKLLQIADAPRVTVEPRKLYSNGDEKTISDQASHRFRLRTPLINHSKIPRVLAAGQEVPIINLKNGEIVLEPLATQLGGEAILDLGDGQRMQVQLVDGNIGHHLNDHAGFPDQGLAGE